jgi:beta-galactosidase
MPTRRDLLKSSLAASALALAPRLPGPAPAPRPVSQTGIDTAPIHIPRRQKLDPGWRFHLGHASDPARDFGFGRTQSTFAKALYVAPAADPRFDDSGWAAIDLPHDWAVDLPFTHDPRLRGHGFKPLGRAYPATSVGWYRRRLPLPADFAGRRLRVRCDGVFRDAMVFFNGEYLGRDFSGYAPFEFDITDLAHVGGDNWLALRVDASLGEGWFYEGAGVYRHVWLIHTHPLHFASDGIAVRCRIGAGGEAHVTVHAEARNQSDAAIRCRLRVSCRNAARQEAGAARSRSADISPWGEAELAAEAVIAHPELWSPESPHLYTADCSLETAAGEPLDSVAITFGVRTLRFDPNRGLLLNHRRVQVQGTCNHQDHAGVGTALPDRLQSYRIERLQAMGCNAIRTSHNPPTPELLDACDRMGMLALDETRMFASTAEGLSQLERLIRRDRNHPSVVMWSLGNEEPQQGTPVGARVLAAMKRLARRLDPTRPVTLAMNGGWGHGASAEVDVQGFNYGNGGGGAMTGPHIDAFHRHFPAQPSIGTETASTVSTRGIYANDPERGYVSAYDVNFPSYAQSAEAWWKVYAAREFLAGGFAWTGFDYRGEPTPYGWPCINSHFGILDTCGFAKDNFFYYRAWWTGEPVLHLLPHWNWSGREGQLIAVWCHTNCESVELFLNGRSQGVRSVERWGHTEWQVAYAPGVLEARGRRGAATLSARRETTGPAAQLALTVDRRRLAGDGEDLAVITAEVQDGHGRRMPTAGDRIGFSVDGPGLILGVGNGDPSSHEPDHARERRAFNGLCMALVQTLRSPGTITVTARAPGLRPASLRLTSSLLS